MADLAVTPEAHRLRVGVAVTLGGFWLTSIAPVIVASSDVHGLVMAFWRSWIGFVVLAGVAAARRQLSWAAILRPAPAGLCFGVSIGLFFWAAQLTSVANASLITVLQPVPLMLAARFVFSEQLRSSDLVWGVIAIGGAIFLVLAAESSGTGDIRGDALAVVSIVIGSAYFAIAKRTLETMSVLPFMVGMFAWAGVALTPLVLISGERIPAATSGDWFKVVVVAFLPGVGHMLLNFAHGRAPLNVMGILQLVIPVNATLLAVWFLDQSVTGLQIIGMAIVMSALTVHALSRARMTPSPQPAS